MSDIFDEVDDELRRQRVEALLKKHQGSILAVLFFIVVAVAGFTYYQHMRRQAAADAGAAYENALRLGHDGKAAESDTALKAIAGKGGDGYALLARFSLAAAEAKADPKAGIAAYDAIAADGAMPQDLKAVALLRAGFLRIDTAPYAELRAKLEPLTVAGEVWRHSARELLAMAAVKAGDKDEAGKWLMAIMADQETPAGVRQRAEIMSAVQAGS